VDCVEFFPLLSFPLADVNADHSRHPEPNGGDGDVADGAPRLL